MGCACLLKNYNSINGETNEIKEIEEDPDNNNNNNINNQENQNENSQNEKDLKNNNPENNQKFIIQIGYNQPLLNNNVLALDTNNNSALNRAKSSPPLPKEDEDSKALYKPVESNLITPEEFQEFCSTNASLNDSIQVEIRPTMSCENKTIYYGEWDTKNNKRHGRGIQVWPDGSKYIGYWKNNQAWGKGKLIHPDGDIYEGDWEGGKPHGMGSYIHVDGSKYVGQWKNDRQEGNGEETWPDGSVYKGEYKEGK